MIVCVHWSNQVDSHRYDLSNRFTKKYPKYMTPKKISYVITNINR